MRGLCIMKFIIKKGVLTGFSGEPEDGSITIPSRVRKIDISVFEQYPLLERVVIPSGLLEIRDYAFAGCQQLQEIIFDGHRHKPLYLGKCVFAGCSRLSSLHLPVLTETYGEGILGKCTALRSLTIHKGGNEFCFSLNGSDNPELLDVIFKQDYSADRQSTVGRTGL